MSDVKELSLLEHMIREELGLPVNNLVIDLIIEIHKEIPSNVNNINSSYSQYLAGRFLKGMDLCADLYAIAIACELKKDIGKKREYGAAFLNRSRDKGFKTAKEKEAFANMDSKYLDACDDYANAKSFRVLVEMRRKDFEKAHYLMRKISEEDVEMNDKTPSGEAEDNWNNFQTQTKNKRRSWSD